MKYLAVIPARGGSKGIPKKNIYPLCKKPLLGYTLDFLSEAAMPHVDVAVSTDSDEIAEVASAYPDVTVIRRPEEISGDTASTEAALIHALDSMEQLGAGPYDAVLTLQPTSPLRQPDTLQAFIRTYEEQQKEYDALLSLHETYTDYWVKKQDTSMENTSGQVLYGRLYPEAPRRRQERDPLYIENSAYYITSVRALRETRSVLGTRVNGFLISEREGMDINEPLDLIVAEALLNEEA